MSFLALIVTLVAIGIGQGKGIRIWIGATFVLFVLGALVGAKHTMPTPQELPIVIASMAVTGASIMTGQWKGLLVWVLGTIGIIIAVLFGLL